MAWQSVLLGSLRLSHTLKCKVRTKLYRKQNTLLQLRLNSSPYRAHHTKMKCWATFSEPSTYFRFCSDTRKVIKSVRKNTSVATLSATQLFAVHYAFTRRRRVCGRTTRCREK